jgi:WD40 repeat protein
MVEKADQVRDHVLASKSAFAKSEAEAIMSIYPAKDKFVELMREDAQRFRQAVNRTQGKTTDRLDDRTPETEPIVALAALFEQELDAKRVAAEAGVTVDELLRVLGISDRLARSFGTLKIPGGVVQRQVVTAGFPELVASLGVGTWNVRVGELHTIKPDEVPTCLAISPDGLLLATGTQHGDVQVWDISTGREVKGFGVSRDKIADFADRESDPFSKVLLKRASEKELTAAILRRFHKGSGTVDSDLTETEQTELINWLHRWQKEIAPRLAKAGFMGEVSSIAFSPDSRRIVSASKDATGLLAPLFVPPSAGIHAWDIVSGREVRRVTIENATILNTIQNIDTTNEQSRVKKVTLSRDTRYALFCFERDAQGDKDHTEYVVLWDIEKNAEVRRFEHPEKGVFCVALSPDARYALTGTWGGTVHLWSLETGAEIRHFHGHASTVYDIAFSSDGRQAISGSGNTVVKPLDRGFRLWDVNSGRQILARESRKDIVRCVALSPDGKRALFGCEGPLNKESDGSQPDFSLHLWDLEADKEIYSYNGHSDGLSAAVFSPSGRLAASASADGTVRVWGLPR